MERRLVIFQGEFDSQFKEQKRKGGLLQCSDKRKFIFGGGVDLKFTKSIAKKQGIKGSDVLKKGNPKSQVQRKNLLCLIEIWRT